MDLQRFKSLRDPYLEEDSDGKKTSLFYDIQKECLRSHSRRPTSSEVTTRRLLLLYNTYLQILLYSLGHGHVGIS